MYNSHNIFNAKLQHKPAQLKGTIRNKKYNKMKRGGGIK